MFVELYSDIFKEDTTLRPYQEKAKKEIFESWDDVDNVMFQMPTGTGKTRLFTSIIRDINDYSIKRREPVKILIIAHRDELIEQIDESLNRYKVPHNVIAGGRKKNYRFPVSVASIQTITNRYNLTDAKKLNVQFVIIDEAHHALAKTYKKLWDLYPGSKKLGVTATPWRMSHESFTDLFDKLVLSMPIKDFIKQGYLSSYKYFSLKSDSDIQSTIDELDFDKYGDYKEASMEEKMDIGSIRAQLLKSYQSLAEGKKGIIYAINIAHAKHLSKEYEEAGYKTVCIDSNTPPSERKDLVEKFRKGKIDIIVNVDIFSEGFDCPDIEFIQLARPTRSLVKYLQQVGRGLRPTNNKEHCIILDNVGMYSRFGLPDARRLWNHHFLGHKVIETVNSFAGKGYGGHREVDMSEGTEDMELIQDTFEDVETVADEQENVSKSQDTDNYNPIQLLESYNFSCENFIFYFIQSKRIYETYIQDDKYFIISELIVDEKNNCVHRNRVGKIASDSWMYWQLLREKIDNLKAITHYGANFTVFHYRVISADTKQEKDKYFDYKGREIDDPEIVSKNYEQTIKQEKISDYIDVPVSKAAFKVVLQNSVYTLYRTIKGVTKPIAKMVSTSNFGFTYELDVALKNVERKSNGLPQIRLHNTDHIDVVRSDESSFTIKKIEKGKGLLLKYDLEGKLLHTGTIASKTILSNPLRADDIDKLKHAFDKKSTSYKFFWFMSLLDIYKETQVKNISFKQILIKMTARAWKYVFLLNGRFSQSDQLPSYLKKVMESAKLKFDATESEVEAALENNYEKIKLNTLLSPLLKNVPFRFLSPWIPFTSNDEVMKKSWDKGSRCPYELYEDHIIISDLWRDALIDIYDGIQLLAEYKLEAYLNIYQNTKEANDFYNTSFPSLSQLLKGIKRRKKQNSVKSFLEKFGFPLSGDISTSEIIKRMPDSKCTIESDGHKKVNVPGDLWSLKILDKLLSEEDLLDTYDNIHLLKGHGLEKYLNSEQSIVDTKNLLAARFVSLSKLLNFIHEHKETKEIKEFLIRYKFSLNEKLKPSDIMKVMPESKCTLDSDGRKRVNIPGGMWSIKLLDKLLSE